MRNAVAALPSIHMAMMLMTGMRAQSERKEEVATSPSGGAAMPMRGQPRVGGSNRGNQCSRGKPQPLLQPSGSGAAVTQSRPGRSVGVVSRRGGSASNAATGASKTSSTRPAIVFFFVDRAVRTRVVSIRY